MFGNAKMAGTLALSVSCSRGSAEVTFVNAPTSAEVKPHSDSTSTISWKWKFLGGKWRVPLLWLLPRMLSKRALREWGLEILSRPRCWLFWRLTVFSRSFQGSLIVESDSSNAISWVNHDNCKLWKLQFYLMRLNPWSPTFMLCFITKFGPPMVWNTLAN